MLATVAFMIIVVLLLLLLAPSLLRSVVRGLDHAIASLERRQAAKVIKDGFIKCDDADGKY